MYGRTPARADDDRRGWETKDIVLEEFRCTAGASFQEKKAA